MLLTLINLFAFVLMFAPQALADASENSFRMKKGFIYGSGLFGNTNLPAFERQKISNALNRTSNSGVSIGEATSWVTNYSTEITDDFVQIANEFQWEYAPMVRISLRNKTPSQAREDLESEIDLARQSLGDEKVKYLLGFNEPWLHSYISPTEAVSLWGDVIQPVAENKSLTLVSPTISPNYSSENTLRTGLGWWVNFLLLCENDPSCHPNSIKKISVHYYSCSSDKIEDLFGAPNNLRKLMIEKLEELKEELYPLSDKNWQSWVHNRPFWVTETNCNNLVRNGSNLEFANPTEICLLSTDQHPNPYKQNGDEIDGGGISSLLQSDRIERVAWINSHKSRADLILQADRKASWTEETLRRKFIQANASKLLHVPGEANNYWSVSAEHTKGLKLTSLAGMYIDAPYFTSETCNVNENALQNHDQLFFINQPMPTPLDLVDIDE